MRRWSGIAFTVIVAILCGSLTRVAPAQAATQQVTAAGKPRIAIRGIEATPSVREQAEKDKKAPALTRIIESIEGQLLVALDRTQKFTVVSRADLRRLLEDQDIQDPGLVKPDDRQRARKFELSGAGYMITVTVDSFADVSTRTVLEGQLGSVNSEIRKIELQSVVKIYNTTSGELLRSFSRPISEQGSTKLLLDQQQDGRATDELLAKVAVKIAVTAVNDIADFVFPAKVVAMTNGVITFNRTEDSGVARGQWWKVFAPGEEIFDPDTGESLGAEEIHIGWARITEAGSRTSKAQAFQDMGIDCGSILKKVEQSDVPEDAASFVPGQGTCSRTTAPARTKAQAAPADGGSTPEVAVNPEETLVPPDAGAAADAQPPLRLAIFVKNRAKDVADEHVMLVEDSIINTATSPRIEIIPREDVVNSVSRFATEGANKGPGGADDAAIDRVFSTQTSAMALAANLGADAVLVGSITSLTVQRRALKDPKLGIDRTIHTLKLTVGYRILDGATGGSLAAGDTVIEDKWDSGGNVAGNEPPIEDLLREAGQKIGAEIRAKLMQGRMRMPTAPAADQMVAVAPSIVDLSLPEITMVDGKATITAGRYKLEPTAVNVYIDGVLVGTAPGEFAAAPGLRKIRCERPLFEPFEAMMRVRPGMRLIIPMKLTAQGLAQWKENARFFEELKRQAVLTEAQLEVAKGMAEFLKQSKINIDTSSLEKLDLESNTNNFWQQSLR